MNPAPLLSVVSGALALMLSLFYMAKSSKVQDLSGELQKQQTEFQSEQTKLAQDQQKFQNQQQVINAASQLAQQVGPAVLNDLGLAARDHKNDKLRALLGKYGVTISDATPAPAGSATPLPGATPKP